MQNPAFFAFWFDCCFHLFDSFGDVSLWISVSLGKWRSVVLHIFFLVLRFGHVLVWVLFLCILLPCYDFDKPKVDWFQNQGITSTATVSQCLLHGCGSKLMCLPWDASTPLVVCFGRHGFD